MTKKKKTLEQYADEMADKTSPKKIKIDGSFAWYLPTGDIVNEDTKNKIYKKIK